MVGLLSVYIETTSCITCDNNVHTKQRKADKMEKVCILKTEWKDTCDR